MSKAAMDSVIEEVVAPLGIGKGKQTVVTEMRRREAVRRTWLEVDISELRMLAQAMTFYGCLPQAMEKLSECTLVLKNKKKRLTCVEVVAPKYFFFFNHFLYIKIFESFAFTK